MSFADELKAARLAAGMSQAELAQQAGISIQSVSKYENGQVASPKYEAVDALEKLLGVRFNIEEEPVTPPQQVPDLDDREFSKDAPPRAKKAAAKKAAPKRGPAAGIPSLRVQLELPYKLAAAGLRPRLPATATTIDAQAGACAAAWDTFLLRYPALREKIEQGGVAADIVNLVMAHAPILQVAREEIAAQQLMEQTYAGGLDGQAA